MNLRIPPDMRCYTIYKHTHTADLSCSLYNADSFAACMTHQKPTPSK